MSAAWSAQAYPVVRQLHSAASEGQLRLPGIDHEGAKEGAGEGEDVGGHPFQVAKAVALQQAARAHTAVSTCAV